MLKKLKIVRFDEKKRENAVVFSQNRPKLTLFDFDFF